MRHLTAIQSGKALARALILPRPSRRFPGMQFSRPLVVAGMYRTGSGLSRAAQGCFEALHQEGMAPLAVDLSGLFNQVNLPSDLPLSPFPKAKSGTLILFANPPEIERALMGLGLRRWHNWHIIGAWAWELPSAPMSWRRQENFVSEIWAPSQFVAEAFRDRYNRPVHVVPHHVPVTHPPPKPSLPGRPIRVLTISDALSSLERKNPIAAVKMFRAAFDLNTSAELIVKCRNLGRFPEYAARLRQAACDDPRIRFEERTLSDQEQASLLTDADILLSPHRSEGFGLNLAEAMAAGKSVIATGWSGNVDFMTQDTAKILPYTLIPATDSTGVYTPEAETVWAEPDFDAGVTALRSLAASPDLRHELGMRAQAWIREHLGTQIFRKVLQPPN